MLGAIRLSDFLELTNSEIIERVKEANIFNKLEILATQSQRAVARQIGNRHLGAIIFKMLGVVAVLRYTGALVKKPKEIPVFTTIYQPQFDTIMISFGRKKLSGFSPYLNINITKDNKVYLIYRNEGKF